MRVAKLPMLDETIENIDRHIIVRFLIMLQINAINSIANRSLAIT